MKKLVKVFSIVTPIGVIAASVGTYVGLSMSKKDIVKTVNNTTAASNDSETKTTADHSYDKFEIFPRIRQEDYYQYIRIENGKAIINDDMVAKIASDVIKKSNIPGGSLNWNYRFEDGDLRTILVITFRWTPANNLMFSRTKTYKINITQDAI